MVLNVIEQLQLKNIEIIDTQWNQDVHQELRHLYGKTQVPLLLIDGEPLYESYDIIEYLKEYANDANRAAN